MKILHKILCLPVILMALAFTACDRDYDMPPLNEPKFELPADAQTITIKQLREKYAAATQSAPITIEDSLYLRARVSADDRRERIHKYADMFGLTADLAQPISAYSHGMKQKLAIISAWIHEPKLIIMDEPFVGLDPAASHLLKGMMREVCNSGGAIFFSTHVLEVAEKLCDKVAIIKSGKLIRSGTMEEVKGDSSLENVFLELEGEEC